MPTYCKTKIANVYTVVCRGWNLIRDLGDDFVAKGAGIAETLQLEE